MKLTSNQEFCSNEEPGHSVNSAVCSLCVHSVVDTESIVGEVTAHCSDGEDGSQVMQLSLPGLHEGNIIVLCDFTNNVVGISVDLPE